MNSKERRKLKRLEMGLNNQIKGPTDIETNSNNSDDLINNLKSSKSQIEIAKILNSMSDPSSYVNPLPLINTLKNLLTPESLEICPLNGTLRRRISRFIYALTPQEEKSAYSLSKPKNIPQPKPQAAAVVVKEVAKNSKAVLVSRIQEDEILPSAVSKSLEVCLNSLKAATSANDVEEAVKDVTSYSISLNENPETTIELSKLLLEILDTGKMSGTAKLKRKLKRLSELLSTAIPVIDESSSQFKTKPNDICTQPSTVVSDSAFNSSNSLTLDNSHTQHSQPEAGNFPYVVFVGQLSFSTTKEDIESHFREVGGVLGPMNVRLLTEKQSKRSKGMAFVQIEGSRELRKCLALHHTELSGRQINVEKSTGGGKTKKSTNLRMIREGVIPARSKIMHAPPPLRANKPENSQQAEYFDRSNNRELENNKRKHSNKFDSENSHPKKKFTGSTNTNSNSNFKHSRPMDDVDQIPTLQSIFKRVS